MLGATGEKQVPIGPFRVRYIRVSNIARSPSGLKYPADGKTALSSHPYDLRRGSVS